MTCVRYFICDPDKRREPLIFVPTAQLAQLLRNINSELGLNLKIPENKPGELFEIRFENFPYPRFLGKVQNEQTYHEFKRALGSWREDLSELKVEGMRLFKEKINRIYDSIKPPTSKKNDEGRRLKMITRQKGWSQTIKRVQRYLGLRQRSNLAPYSGEKKNATSY
jgi:hypothetical protein